MTTVTQGTCGACGASTLGTRYCENCGADQQSESLAAAGVAAPDSLLTRLRVATVAGALLVMTVPSIASTIAYAVNDYSQVGPRVITVLLVLATTLAAVFAARLDGAPGNARTGAVVLASIVGGLAAIAAVLSPGYVSALWLFPIALFLSWAISARFRGFGYWGLGIGVAVVVVESLVSGFLYSLQYSGGGTAGYEIVSVILDAIVFAAAIGSAIGFERIHARRPVRERPLPAQYAPGTGGQAIPGDPGGSYYSERTNGLAIAALVLGIVGGTIVTIVLGHVALGQIRRTGERGHGMAVVGLVLGYVWTAVVVVLLIVYVSIWANALQALSHPYGTY
jgi:Domain of unknown function (DUF4190)